MQTKKISVEMHSKQRAFLSMQHKFRAYVAGYGAGKTWCGGMAMCLGYIKHRGINQGFFAPSYPQIRDIFYPTIEEVAASFGFRVEIREGNKEVHFYRGRNYLGTTICRSMDNPASIVGFKIGSALVDEFDTMDTKKAHAAWNKIIGRMRYNVEGCRNGIDVTTTPEGFKATYNLFVKAVADDPSKAHNYGLVKASTYDNRHNLPADYIPSLLEAYPTELIKAYINGDFVNLTSGTVYYCFDRLLNNSHAVYEYCEDIHIGMDFNICNMSAVVVVYREGQPVVIDEITKILDTPAMIAEIKQRYGRSQVTVYPDASGRSGNSTNASISDVSLLMDAGFDVDAPNTNPRVRDRVVSVNAMFKNALGHRRLKVNTDKCKLLTADLEQQAYNKNGEPDKTSGNDHRPDALGYFIHRVHPAVGRPEVIIR